MINERFPVAKITREYRADLQLTYRRFAEKLNESLVNTRVSHQSVSNWEKGKNEPETDFLLLCVNVYADWRQRWAIAVLQAKLPGVFGTGMVTLPGD